ncbi:excinuclease ABC subunit UvrC [Cryptobacterium curtum]|uniref:excinuclease ABC subunit UvrC n=1 Tax=Cryptobacterium curtum TaxID=84163 RepID=UPI0028D2ED18|nr:excinuclease ABC subunit UvrC [Cryptobacterium curtum]
MTDIDHIERIKRELASVPTLPGVYLWKDEAGQVIYVGKAKQLRARMRQYVNFQDDRAKIPLLVDQIRSFEYIVVENEYESLVLEKNLINQYSPFFNADFKDDKSYPFIALTKGDVFPAIKFTREKHRADTLYFGPYTDSRAARNLIDIVRRIVPLCSASCSQWRQMKRIIDRDGYEAFKKNPMKPCFDCHVGLAPGACCGRITPEEYEENLTRVARFLRGSCREFTRELSHDMQKAAADLDFERAGRLKARLDIIRGLEDKQHAVVSDSLNADVIGIFREETITGVHVLMVREGRVINGNEFVLNKGTNVSDDDLLRNFLLRYYDVATSIPREVILEKLPDDADTMGDWLTRKLANSHGARVRFAQPERGEKRELLDMATTNARHTLMRYMVRTNYEDKRINEALLQLESALALPEPPLRIECFDISTLHGTYTVASMVVFTDGRPDKSQYRRFKIKADLDEANDFLSMQEVLGRRYAPERMADERFGRKPDLLILDGGKPQLSAAIEQLGSMGVDIPLAGLAKRDEELFVPWQESGPVVLPSGSASLYLVKRVRDESHRFAITFHRQLRGKGMTASILDEVEGIGPVRKKALLRHFKSFKNLRQASLEDLEASRVLPVEVARELFAVLAQYNDLREETDAANATTNRDVPQSSTSQADASMLSSVDVSANMIDDPSTESED